MRIFTYTLRAGGGDWSAYDLVLDGQVIGELITGADGPQLTINAGAGLTADEIEFLHERASGL